MSLKKKILASVFAVALATSVLSISAFAASDTINDLLPPNQGDTEVSTVARESSTVGYFTITIDSISGGYTSVRAWTEVGLFGNNCSSTNKSVGVGTTNCPYSDIPQAGENVTLNLDNPVYTTDTPRVIGSWTPN
jgi:hypothetical protein